MLRFMCSRCQKSLSAPDEKSGATVTCPGCKHPLTIPSAAPASHPLLLAVTVAAASVAVFLVSMIGLMIALNWVSPDKKSTQSQIVQGKPPAHQNSAVTKSAPPVSTSPPVTITLDQLVGSPEQYNNRKVVLDKVLLCGFKKLDTAVAAIVTNSRGTMLTGYGDVIAVIPKELAGKIIGDTEINLGYGVSSNQYLVKIVCTLAKRKVDFSEEWVADISMIGFYSGGGAIIKKSFGEDQVGSNPVPSAPLPVPSGGEVTLANYNRIQNGMTKFQVKTILGTFSSSGSGDIGQTFEIYSSIGRRGAPEGFARSVVTITYDSDGRVVRKEKVGLEY